ncbi:MAG: FxsA family protein [Thermoanaerobaculia bacterium]
MTRVTVVRVMGADTTFRRGGDGALRRAPRRGRGIIFSVGRLLVLFIVVPLVELVLLIRLGKVIGLPATLALIVFTGALGAFLARRQGLAVLDEVRAEMAEGRIPAGPIVDGVIILLAAAVLMTPGVLTDLCGFLCLVPAFRRSLKGYLRGRFERAVRGGEATVSGDFGGGPFATREVRDVTPREDRIEGHDGPPDG